MSPSERIIPVIDLKGGQVVRGVAGDRNRYAPVVSRVARDSRPETVAAAFVEHFSCPTIYVADLDAISGGEPDWSSHLAIASSGASLILDVGLRSAATAKKVIEWNLAKSIARSRPVISKLVVATESLQSIEEMATRVAECRGIDVTLSIDLKHGEWFQPTEDRQRPMRFGGRTPEEVVGIAMSLGVDSVIVLDLAAVGTANGPITLNLCRNIRDRHAEIELISGGGVRGMADVHAYVDVGCDGVLVASALHDGRITATGDKLRN